MSEEEQILLTPSISIKVNYLLEEQLTNGLPSSLAITHYSLVCCT